MTTKKLHLDAAQTMFFERELEEIDNRMFDVRYAKLELFELVQPKPLDPATETYTFRSFDSRGVAVMTSDYASGSPRVDVAGVEETSKVRSMRVSFGYSIQEIRAAAKEGRPLDAMKAAGARRAINEKMNSVGLLGDSDHNLQGLFNISGAGSYTVPNDGTGSTTTWSTKTAAQIERDIFGILDQIPTVTKEVEKPTRLLMPYSRLRLINSMAHSATGPSDLTVLKYVQAQRPGVEIRGALLLDTAGASSSARMMAYDPNPENLELLLPVAFESFPAERRGMEYVIECHARMGSVVCRYPLTVCYGDGI